MNNSDGYVISFPAGARGRLIANIISKMLTGSTEKMQFTSYNSAHVHINDSNIMPLDDYKSFILKNNTIKNLTPILLSHTFPNFKHIDNDENFKNKRILIINVSKDDINEIILNQLIKNIMPRIKDMVENNHLSDREIKLIAEWQNFYLKKANIIFDEKILNNPDSTNEFLKFAIDNVLLHRLVPYKFYGPIVPDSDRVLNLQFNSLFEKNNDKYNTLEKLSKWIGCPYNESVVSDFAEYDATKYNIFKTYYPEFLQQK